MGKITDSMRRIVGAVEEKTGFFFMEEEVGSIYEHTARKLALNRIGDDYFPVLFENELEDYLMRRRINAMGAMA